MHHRISMPKKKFTTEDLKPADCSNQQPEFGRCRDCTQLFGLKRGTLYNLLADGRIRGVLLRVRGQKSGVRLFDLASVREYIEQCGRHSAPRPRQSQAGTLSGERP